VEGTLIMIAAVGIITAAVQRLLAPKPLEQVGLGLGVSLAASIINLIVALILTRASRQYNSITLEANAQHLMTDVWTSAGVLIGVGAVALTGWQRLDPLIACIVAGNIIWSGVRIVRKSVLGLMDTALPDKEQAIIRGILDQHRENGVQYHALRTRQAGSRSFVSFHVLVPGTWTVKHGHDLLEMIEADLRLALPNITVFTHLESLTDPSSWNDTSLDRPETPQAEEKKEDLPQTPDHKNPK